MRLPGQETGKHLQIDPSKPASVLETWALEDAHQSIWASQMPRDSAPVLSLHRAQRGSALLMITQAGSIGAGPRPLVNHTGVLRLQPRAFSHRALERSSQILLRLGSLGSLHGGGTCKYLLMEKFPKALALCSWHHRLVSCEGYGVAEASHQFLSAPDHCVGGRPSRQGGRLLSYHVR